MNDFLNSTKAEVSSIAILIIAVIIAIVSAKYLTRNGEVVEIQPVMFETTAIADSTIHDSVDKVHYQKNRKENNRSKFNKSPGEYGSYSSREHEPRQAWPRHTRPAPTPCHPFDPNSVPTDSLVNWGMSKYAVNNFTRYMENGGSFKRREDLLKIYGMDTMFYSQIRDCITLPDLPPGPVITDLNTIDSATLTQYKGIGPVLASRIIKFRDALGGFHSIDQLTEVYGLPPETFEQVRPQFILSNKFNKIPINAASAQELAAHPYISYKQANSMASFIENHGPLRNPEEIYRLYFADTAWVMKITPYLSFEGQRLSSQQD